MANISHSYPELIQAKIAKSDWHGAVRDMIELYTQERDKNLLVQLRNLRMTAGQHLVEMDDRENRSPCPLLREDPFPEVKNDIPSILASDLTADILAGAIRHHGALIVRGYANSTFCERSRDDIDQVLKSAERFYSVRPEVREQMLKKDGGNDVWFSLFPQIEGHSTSFDAFMMSRTGAVWTFLSPKVTHHLTKFFDRSGLKPILKDYFEDDPCMSLNKSVLRRVSPLENPADWHQDGSFMSSDIKSLNLWVALSECGQGTPRPGMDFVPKRFDEVVEAGSNGAYFNWSVSPKSIRERYEDAPPVRPYFDEGDAIFFDHFNLHATSYDESFNEPRYAIETWFFAQRYNAGNQTPAFW